MITLSRPDQVWVDSVLGVARKRPKRKFTTQDTELAETLKTAAVPRRFGTVERGRTNGRPGLRLGA